MLRPEWSTKLQKDFHWAKIVEGIQSNFLIIGEAGTELHLPDLSGWRSEDNMVKTSKTHISDIINNQLS